VTHKAFQLTEDQRSLITHCLRLMAETFKEDAKVRKEDQTWVFTFTQQAEQAQTLADRLDNAVEIIVGQEAE
jgi:hypothetical protein